MRTLTEGSPGTLPKRPHMSGNSFWRSDCAVFGVRGRPAYGIPQLCSTVSPPSPLEWTTTCFPSCSRKWLASRARTTSPAAVYSVDPVVPLENDVVYSNSPSVLYDRPMPSSLSSKKLTSHSTESSDSLVNLYRPCRRPSASRQLSTATPCCFSSTFRYLVCEGQTMVSGGAPLLAVGARA